MYYTYWLAQGPHFETRAEVDAIDKLGGEMVGMTMAREVKLANGLHSILSDLYFIKLGSRKGTWN